MWTLQTLKQAEPHPIDKPLRTCRDGRRTFRADPCRTMSFQWKWDPARQDMYYWNPAGNCYVYQKYGQIFPSQEYNVQGLVEAGPVEQITEPQALQFGIRAHKKVRETPGDAETLDPREYPIETPQVHRLIHPRIQKALPRLHLLQDREGIQGPLARASGEPPSWTNIHHREFRRVDIRQIPMVCSDS